MTETTDWLQITRGDAPLVGAAALVYRRDLLP